MIGIVGDIVLGRSMREFRRDCWNHAGTDVAESCCLAYPTPTSCRVVSFPFLDMAYQGFGAGIAEDGAVVARFVEAGGPLDRKSTRLNSSH